MPVFCRKCGRKNADDAVFCEACGTPFVGTEPPIPAGSPATRAPAAVGGPSVGQVIGGRYRIDGLIGAGGMATVYRGTHVDLGHAVAIKVMAPNLALDTNLVERFRQEARIQAQLQHPNIVLVTDFVAEGQVVAFVMQLVEGPTLADLLEGQAGPIVPARCREILAPVLDAVGYAHAAGVVHRDLKPSNVILATVAGKEVPKLADFGIAKVLAEGARRTGTGTKMGTLWYMAPEQFQSARNVDHRADLYSLGVMLFEMLTGRVPFGGETEWQVMKGHLETPPPPPRSVVPGISPALEAVVLRAMAKLPEQRFGSAAEFAAALAASLKPAAARAPARAPAPAPAPRAAPTVVEDRRPAEAPAPAAPSPPPARPAVPPRGPPRPVGPTGVEQAERGRAGEARPAPPRGEPAEPPRWSTRTTLVVIVAIGLVVMVTAIIADRACKGVPAGTWLDATRGLLWQNVPDGTARNWADAMRYCDGLSLRGYDDWRLPTISELRSFIRGCANTAAGGGCDVTDGCLGSECLSGGCNGCSGGGGPTADGCYWDAAAGGPCGPYWSSSSYAGGASDAWLVGFNDGYVSYYGKASTVYVRCVRRGP